MIIHNKEFTEENFLAEVIKSKEQDKPTDTLRDFIYELVISESHKQISKIDSLDRVIFEAKAINDCYNHFHELNEKPLIQLKIIILGSFADNFGKLLK